ncbi:tetratricopeptide repeat protein [Roseburia hominis]
MTKNYYEPCEELKQCNEFIEKYYKTGDYVTCFQEHMKLAKKGYPLAECQIGWFYYSGLGVERNENEAFLWTKRAAEHGDRDAQNNLGEFYEEGIGTEKDLEQAKAWYVKAAQNDSPEGIEKCLALGIEY